MNTPIGGWKTKLGAGLLGAGSLILANLDLVFALFPELAPWARMISILLLGTGAGTGLLGIAHKLERAARASENKDPSTPDREHLMAAIRFLRRKGYVIQRPDKPV